MLTRKWQIAVPLGLFLAVLLLGGCLPFVAPRAPAHLTFQVNLALQLTLDGDGRVISAAGLNEAGRALLRDMDVRNRSMGDVLREITGKLIAEGTLKTGHEVVLALRPADGAAPDTLIGLAAEAEETVARRITGARLQVKVTGVVVSAEFYDAASGYGLLPDAYADLLEAGVPPENLLAIIDHHQRAGVAPETFKEELETIVAAMIDMHEAGVSDGAALAVLMAAMEAGVNLDELTTVAAALIDLIEEGVPEAEAVARTLEAIRAGQFGNDEGDEGRDDNDEPPTAPEPGAGQNDN